MRQLQPATQPHRLFLDIHQGFECRAVEQPDRAQVHHQLGVAHLQAGGCCVNQLAYFRLAHQRRTRRQVRHHTHARAQHLIGQVFR